MNLSLNSTVKVIIGNSSRLYRVVEVEDQNSALISPQVPTTKDPPQSRIILIDNQWQVAGLENIKHEVIPEFKPVNNFQTINQATLIKLISRHTSQFSATLLNKSGLLSKKLVLHIDQNNKNLRNLPRDLKYLKIINISNYNVEVEKLPPSLLSLEFEGDYRSLLFRLTENNLNLLSYLPKTLNVLSLPFDFDQEIEQLSQFTDLRKLKFGYLFNQPLSSLNINGYLIKYLPSSLTSLTFGHDYQHAIEFEKKGIYYSLIPSSVTHLTFNNTPVKLRILPPNLVYLSFVNSEINQSLDDILPLSLEYLILGPRYNQPFNKPLPPNLKVLVFNRSPYNYHFTYVNNGDQSILPPGLQALLFIGNCGYRRTFLFGNLNQGIVKSVLPAGLKYLTSGKYYDTPLILNRNGIKKSALPDSLQFLGLGLHYNQPLDILPLKLQLLSFSDYRGRIAETSVLSEELIFPKKESELNLNFFLKNIIPVSTGIGSFNHPLPHIPSSLKYLFLSPNFNQVLPPLSLSLEILVFGDDYDRDIEVFPPYLKELKLGAKFNQSLALVNDQDELILFLPIFLEKLTFGDNFNYEIGLVTEDSEFSISLLPPLLKELTFGKFFNQEIGELGKSFLPFTLVKLTFGKNFNRRIETNVGGEIISFIPFSLKELTFGSSFNWNINNLPDSIEKLIIGSYTTSPFDYSGGSIQSNFKQLIYRLPTSLKYLIISKDYVNDLKVKFPGIYISYAPE